VSRLVVEDADICDFATAIVEFDGESGYAIVSIDADAAASARGPTDTTQLRAAVEMPEPRTPTRRGVSESAWPIG
jgi:hypothetical protein